MSFTSAIFSRPDIGDRPAFYFPDSQFDPITFRALDSITQNVARRIAQLGILPNELVALDLSNEYLHAVLLVSCARAGIATVSGVPGSLAGIAVKATFSDRQPMRTELYPVHAVTQQWLSDSVDQSPYRFPQVSGDQLCRVMLTSGTTGTPKVSYLTYDMVQERIDSYLPAFGQDFAGATNVMCGMQLSSSLGFGFLFNALARGASYCADSKDFDQLSAAIKKLDIRVLIVSPATLAELLRYCETHGRTTRLVENIYTAGSLIGPELESRVRGVLCDKLVVFYGTTETGVVAVRASPGTLGDVGTIVASKRVEILGEDGKEKPQGQSGAIRIRNVDGSASFYDQNGIQERQGIDHFMPGDLGLIDSRHHLIMLGRQDSIINAGGVKTSPELLEQIICSAPGVRDCGVITRRDGMGIDRIVAFLVLRPGWAEGPFLTHCKEKIGHHFLPTKFVILKSIARNANGKIDRQALARQET